MAIDKIHGGQDPYITRIQQTDQLSKLAGNDGAAKSGKRDEVSLSPEAQELQRLLKEVRNSPDVREDLVARLKEQIASGQYKVDAEQLADKLLGLD